MTRLSITALGVVLAAGMLATAAPPAAAPYEDGNRLTVDPIGDLANHPQPRSPGITVDVFASSAPNGYGSPSFNSYVAKALYALENNLATNGNRATDPTAYERAPSIVVPSDIAVTSFANWRGVLSPPAPFASEYGNRMHFGLHAYGDGSTKFRLADLTFALHSDDPTDTLVFVGDFIGYGYSSTRYGIDWVDGIKGNGNDVVYTTGNGTTLVDEIVYVGVGNAWWPSGSTPQADMDDYLAWVASESPIDVTCTYAILGYVGSDDVQVVYAPTTLEVYPPDVPDEEIPEINVGDAPPGFEPDSWQNTQVAGGKVNWHARYLADGDALSTLFPSQAAMLTINDIESLSYWTNRPGGTAAAEDWSLYIYTRYKVGGDGSWYGYRFINNYGAHTSTDAWTTYSTSTGMTFQKSSGTPTAHMDWTTFKATYGTELVEMISVQTHTNFLDFNGYMDGLVITLADGSTGRVDFVAPGLTLEPDRECYAVGDTVTVELWMNGVPDAIVGGQFLLAYDTAKLNLLSVVHASPFTETYEQYPAAGQLDYAVNIPPTGSVTGDAKMAILTFAALADLCADSGLVTWRTGDPPTRLSTDQAEAVYPDLIDLDVLDDVAPVIDCPDDTTIECTESTNPSNTGDATALDNCDPTPSIAYSDTATVGVSSTNPAGWTLFATLPYSNTPGGDGAAEFVAGPGTPPLGTGSARLFTGTDGEQSAQMRNSTWAGTRIDAIERLEYRTYATQWNGSQLPYLTIWVDTDNDTVADDRLWFEPAYSAAAYSPPVVQGPPALNTWQTWDTLNGNWYSDNHFGPGTSSRPLVDYLALEPDATIVQNGALGGIRIASGFASASDVFEAYVDAVIIATATTSTTYDFEETGCGDHAITRTWTATDLCGNTSTCTQVITIEDSTPPVATPGTIAACYASSALAEAAAIAATDATDNCTDEEDLAFSAVTTGTCFAEVEVTVADACGNEDSVLYETRIDATPPVVVAPADVVVNADAGDCTWTPDYAEPFDTAPSLCATQTPDCWYVDRYAPAGFTNALFGGQMRLKHSIAGADLQGNAFYNTQGRKYDIDMPVGTVLAVDLYIGADFEANLRRADMWATTFDGTPDVSGYPIVGFVNDDGTAANNRFRAYTQDTDQNPGNGYTAGWVDMGLPTGFAYGAWYHLEIELTASSYIFTVTAPDSSTVTFTDVVTFGSVRLGNVILQAYNFGADYDVYWDNVTLGPAGPIVTDNCTDVTVTYVRSDNASLTLYDPFPQGTTTITWTATDACGLDSMDTQTVTVNDVSEMAVTVQLSPTVVAGPLERCITFKLYDCVGGPPVETVEEVLTFTGGIASTTLEVPCGSYTCITAQDELHTLRRTDEAFGVVGTQYVANFTGADQLIGGNLNNDNWVDILDFGVYSWKFGTTISANTTCTTPYPHADISGNGQVNTEDFTFISGNFFKGHEADCCGAKATDAGPVADISVAELKKLGLGHLAVADLNRDGRLNEADVAAFAAGARPARTRIDRAQSGTDVPAVQGGVLDPVRD